MQRINETLAFSAGSANILGFFFHSRRSNTLSLRRQVQLRKIRRSHEPPPSETGRSLSEILESPAESQKYTAAFSEPSNIGRNVMTPTSCMECVSYGVVAGDDIQPGDHIVYAGTVYDHHAIVASVKASKKEPNNKNKRNVTVIHASNTITGLFAGLKFFSGKAKILRKEEELDLQKTKIIKVNYMFKKYSPGEIVKRAIHELDNLNTAEAKFEYHLFKSNCEHFATWCVTGQRGSVQVGKLILTMKLLWSVGLRGIGDEQIRNYEAYNSGMLCESCFERNKMFSEVPKRPITSPEDVGVGDIITFSYYRLDHDAIVMNIKETNSSHLEVVIAHYAFCGLFWHRTIKQEPLTIPLDGTMTAVDYSDTEYSIRSPEDVVERAQRRLGEQLFTFFANDSSHFARWCKLKEETV